MLVRLTVFDAVPVVEGVDVREADCVVVPDPVDVDVLEDVVVTVPVAVLTGLIVPFSELVGVGVLRAVTVPLREPVSVADVLCDAVERADGVPVELRVVDGDDFPDVVLDAVARVVDEMEAVVLELAVTRAVPLSDVLAVVVREIALLRVVLAVAVGERL